MGVHLGEMWYCSFIDDLYVFVLICTRDDIYYQATSMILTSYHPSLPIYLPADSISKTRIKVRVSWAGLINSEQELSPNSPNI
jgi:hypothetical protein